MAWIRKALASSGHVCTVERNVRTLLARNTALVRKIDVEDIHKALIFIIREGIQGGNLRSSRHIDVNIVAGIYPHRHRPWEHKLQRHTGLFELIDHSDNPGVRPPHQTKNGPHSRKQ